MTRSYGQSSQEPKGYISIGENRRISISLLEKADLSTFLHETGHLYLEVLGDLAERFDASPQVVEDYDRLLKWLGAQDRASLTTEQHEQFARGFEAYLREGNAPSIALMPVFQRFKAWLTRIYQRLESLNVTLTDEVRGVFDRILATDEEIRQAREAEDLKALFANAEAAGMGEKEFAAYEKLTARAILEAHDTVLAEKMAEFEKENQAQWLQEREKVQAKVTEEVMNSPAEQAWATLRKGELPNGQRLKLNKQSLVDGFGAAYLKRIWTGLYSVEGGVDVDTATRRRRCPRARCCSWPRVRPSITPQLRTQVEALAAEVRRLMRGGILPPPADDPELCQACPLIDICQPKFGRRAGEAGGIGG